MLNSRSAVPSLSNRDRRKQSTDSCGCVAEAKSETPSCIAVCLGISCVGMSAEKNEEFVKPREANRYLQSMAVLGELAKQCAGAALRIYRRDMQGEESMHSVCSERQTHQLLPTQSSFTTGLMWLILIYTTD